MTSVYVVAWSREGHKLFEGSGHSSVREAVAFVRGGTRLEERLVLCISEPPPASGPDAAVCVPLRTFEDFEARAAEVVAGWERAWELIDSMPRAHREAARDHLRGAVLTAMLSAAVIGVERSSFDEELGF